MVIERQRYTQEYKDEAVRLSMQPGVVIADVARELGLNPKNLYRWCDKAQQEVKAQQVESSETQEIKRLRAELAAVKQERDILKKALRIFSQEI